MRSDLTGKEDEPEKFAQLVFRSGPGIDKAIAFDVLPEEVGDVDEAGDIFVIELKLPGDAVGRELVVTLKEVQAKLVPQGQKLDQLLENARFLRGRRPTAR
jgi:hypothetical protein